MKTIKLLLSICFAISRLTIYGQIASFIAPDTVCLGQTITIQNTSSGASTYYWNFCSGYIGNTPIGQNLGNLGNLNGPVYIALADDNNNKFTFVTNHLSGTLTRNYYGTSYSNNPVSVNLGNCGVIDNQVEGIQIINENGNWYGLLTGGLNNYVIRLNFGNSLFNTPTGTNFGNIGGLLSYPHTIYTFKESGNWYSFVGDYSISTLILLNFGNSLTNTPTATSIGNIGTLNGPVGFFPVQKSGLWHLFVVNRNSNSLSRLDFGTSLLNTPTGVNFGSLGCLNYPRSITIIQDCQEVFGMIVNENSNDIVRVTFPNGLLNTPFGTSLGNIANFSFPHHISEVYRLKDTLYAFIANVSNNTLSRIYFPSCNNSSISSSTLANPPSYTYNAIGTYNVSLVINENTPSQSNYCKQIVVVNSIVAHITGDTVYCAGDSIKLCANAPPGSTYQWNGPNGFSSTNPNIIVPHASQANAGAYNLVAYNNGCSSSVISVFVTVVNPPVVNLGSDINICTGFTSVNLNANNPGCYYVWSTGATTQSIAATTSGAFSVTVTNNSGCSSSDAIQINIVNQISVNLGNDTSICQGSNIVLNAGNAGSQYQWSTGQTTQSISVNSEGDYMVSVTNYSCHDADTISINVVPMPSIFLGNDTVICEGDVIILSPGTGFNGYIWSTGSINNYLQITVPGTYSVQIFDGTCYVSDVITISECDYEIWVPNVFTPNSDGINDFFYPVYFNIDSISLMIFNRWGNQLYEGSGRAAIWNGKYLGRQCPDGVYYYIIEYQKNGFKERHGTVTLLH